MNDTEKDIPLMVPLPAFIYGQSQEVRFLSLLILHQRRKNKDRTEGINLWNKLYHRADDAMLNDRASHSRYFSDELDAQFFC